MRLRFYEKHKLGRENGRGWCGQAEHEGPVEHREGESPVVGWIRR